MADIQPTLGASPVEWVRWTWTPVTNADTFVEVNVGGGSRDIIAQVVGTFGSATVVLQGSVDGGTTWQTVKDIDGSDISLTAAGFAEIRTAWPRMRFSASGGDGTQSVTATLARAGTR